jgi:hypothetical protein
MDQMQKLFSMRTDTPEGVAFLDALDALRQAERPQLSRTAMVKRLVFDAARKSPRARERQKERA